jgi:hypothetical protein
MCKHFARSAGSDNNKPAASLAVAVQHATALHCVIEFCKYLNNKLCLIALTAAHT